MSDLGQALIKAFGTFRTDPQGVEKALEAFVDERIAIARKARKPRAPIAPLEIDGFAEWYAAYPRRIARKAAARAYTAARREVDRDVLLTAAKRYAAQVAGTKPELVKMPATWLNGGCWADEYPAAVITGASAPHAPDSVWIDRLRYHAGQDGFPIGYWQVAWGRIEDVPAPARATFEARFGKIRA